MTVVVVFLFFNTLRNCFFILLCVEGVKRKRCTPMKTERWELRWLCVYYESRGQKIIIKTICYICCLGRKKGRIRYFEVPPAGIEPTISCSVGRRLIHWATGAELLFVAAVTMPCLMASLLIYDDFPWYIYELLRLAFFANDAGHKSWNLVKRDEE